MNEQVLTGRDLLDGGWETGPALGKALDIANAFLAAGQSKADMLAQLGQCCAFHL